MGHVLPRGFLRRCAVLLLVIAPAFLLAGCGLFQRAQRAAWREQADKQCMAESRVHLSDMIQKASAIDGPGICGMIEPLKVTALLDGQVTLNATQTINCPMTDALETWLRDFVQPLAMARFHQQIVGLSSMGAYSCRSIDNKWGANLSEHAYGNAIDISGFTLADGHTISVTRNWSRGTEQEKAFLREVHASACAVFTTVLGPGADGYHTDHFHLDLALHAMTSTGPRRICKPLPSPQLLPVPKKQDDLPDPPELDEDLDVVQSHAPNQHDYSPHAIASLLANVPPEPPHRQQTLEMHMLASPAISSPVASAPIKPAPVVASVAVPSSPPHNGQQGAAPSAMPHIMRDVPQPKPRPERLQSFDLDDVTSSVPRH
jgi:Extensin-like protein C-terminus